MIALLEVDVLRIVMIGNLTIINLHGLRNFLILSSIGYQL